MMSMKEVKKNVEAGYEKDILSTRGLLRIGCWNVRTMYEAGKRDQVLREMENSELQFQYPRSVLVNAGGYDLERTSVKTRQIIRYRATNTLRRPQIKHYTSSIKGRGTKQTGTS